MEDCLTEMVISFLVGTVFGVCNAALTLLLVFKRLKRYAPQWGK